MGLARLVKENGKPALCGQDVSVSVIRTGDSSRRAGDNSTYVSIDGGVTFVGVRIGVGVARRLGTAGLHATIFRWSIGARIGW